MFTIKSILSALAVSAIGSLPVLAQSDDSGRNVLVFGDSLTWGWIPASPIVPTARYAPEDRWPSILQATLGGGYNVITEGLSGRTTNIDDPTAAGLMNGADYLGAALVSNEPIDLIVILLGTNDSKTYLKRSALEIGLGMGELINIVQEGSGLGWYSYETDVPDILVISPPLLGPAIDPLAAEIFAGSNDKLAQLPAIYGKIAEAANVHFFDAGTVVTADDVGPDGIHLLVQGNRDLGAAVADRVRAILE